MHRTNRIRLFPTKKQEVCLKKCVGVARFSFNWALAEWGKRYKEGKNSTAYILIKYLNSIKRQEFPWMMDVSKEIPQYAIHNLQAAFNQFFAKTGKYPKFKKKHWRDSFTFADVGTVRVNDNIIKLPRIGAVSMAEPLFHIGRITKTTVSHKAGRWYASVTVDIPENETTIRENQAQTVGVDLGISTFCTLSTGEKIENPKFYRSALRRLRLRQRIVSRRHKGSKNREKARRRLARTHASISNRRNGFIHRVTASLAKNFGIIVIEDLNVAGMCKNRNIAQAISDVSFGEFRRQLEYKAPGRVIVAGRFFPSSKTCSLCGEVVDSLPLSIREWTCKCGARHDRDINAAINLKNLGLRKSEVTPVETGIRSLERVG